MINYVLIYKIQYIICLIIYLLEKLIFKYHKHKDIFKKLLYIDKYDNIHSVSILYLIFDIQIYTLKILSDRLITIYYEKSKISNVFIKNEENMTTDNKIILSIIYLDQYNFINYLKVYNCGIIYHYTNMFTHIYNYLGERRIEYNIL
jgi:hypothetical protein